MVFKNKNILLCNSFKKGILILLTIFSTILLLRLSINLLLILAFSPLDKTALWTTFCLCNTLKSFAFLLASQVAKAIVLILPLILIYYGLFYKYLYNFIDFSTERCKTKLVIVSLSKAKTPYTRPSFIDHLNHLIGLAYARPSFAFFSGLGVLELASGGGLGSDMAQSIETVNDSSDDSDDTGNFFINSPLENNEYNPLISMIEELDNFNL